MDLSAIGLTAGKSAAPHVIALSKSIGRHAYDDFVATCTNIFSDHVKTSYLRCKSLKTIVTRSSAIDLEQHYVNLEFSGDSERTDMDLSRSLQAGNERLLVVGSAGSGKSMFMRWCVLQLIASMPHHQRIPLFLEAREIPERLSTSNIEIILFQKCASSSSKATFDQFVIGLKKGFFIPIIDGLDEIAPKKRSAFLGELSDFQRRFPETPIVCSSRPDRSLESAVGLEVYRVNNMSLEQIADVINKSVFDEDKKRSFIQELESGLYEKHHSFLSNPLLATIMLITFDDTSKIPEKLSLFYSQAYEALFYKHDSSKGVYSRERYTDLDIEDFEAIFRAFCFKSYAKGKFTFEATELSYLMKEAIEFSRKSVVKSDDFIKDCINSLCLMVEDGLYITFSHRSFQEYFCARFMLFYSGEDYFRIIDNLARRSAENVVKLIGELNYNKILREWALPKVKELYDLIDSHDMDNLQDVVNVVNAFVSDIGFHDENLEISNYAYTMDKEAASLRALNSLLRSGGFRTEIDVFSGLLAGENSTECECFINEEISENSNFILQLGDGERDEDNCIYFEVSKHDDWVLNSRIPSCLRLTSDHLKRAEAEILLFLEQESKFSLDVASLFGEAH
ncbi:NACHT domain-containing protein [Sphingobium sp. LSP13-1-1.1]|uniref:NACHT domain-containing protein n=1 Tax=Sphingobium sp. LSP13-1-1.1 TaxID=3135234 RepID=UPI00342F15DB